MPETPLTTRDITVRLSDAGGILRPGMVLIATLSAQDTDGDRVVQVLPVETEITEDGATLTLWPTTRGLRGVHYRIEARVVQEIIRGRPFAKEMDVGRIQPADIDGQVLGDLLNVTVPPDSPGYYTTLPADDLAALREELTRLGTTWVVYAGETDISVTLSTAPEVIVSETAETVVMEFV